MTHQPPATDLPTRLRDLAREVLSLGYGPGRRSPEDTVMQKHEIAAQLRRIAAEAERLPTTQRRS